MNNRIMAMLFALVAAMFISVVPVKADALGLSTDTAHKHAPVEHKATEATCMQEGNIAYYSCSGCEKISLNKEFTEIITLEKVKLAKNDDHKLTKLGVDKEATCYATGSVSYYKCGVCGNCYTDESAKEILTDSVLPMKEHVWEWTYNEASHWQKCAAKGCTQTKGTAAHEKQCLDNKDGTHTWTCKVEGCGWDVKAEAHSDANKNCSCDFCDAEMHNLVHVDAKAPTCEVNGNVEYWFCNNANGCKKSFTDETAQTVLTDSVVKATGHDFDPVKWGEGNQEQHWTLCNNEGCKQMGSIGKHSWKVIDNGDGKHGWGCEDCGYISKDIADHVFENKDGKCVCKVCGFAQDHQYGDYLIHQNEQGGSDHHYQVCKVCNATTDFEAHMYKTVKSTDGVVHGLTCEICGRATTQNCSDKNNDCICDKEGCGTPLKHATKDMQYRETPATCTETGWAKHYECLKCGNRFDLSGKPTTEEAVKTPALGHEFGGEGYGWRETEDGTAHFKKCINKCGTNVYSTADGVVVGEEVHTHGSWYYNKDGKHCEICAVCGLAYGDEDHEYKTPVQTDVLSGVAKKQQHGLKCECGDVKYEVCTFDNGCVCTVCGAARIHAADHVQFYDKKEPTCTEPGKEYHAICKTCNAYFLTGTGKLVPATEKDIVIDALDHAWEEGTEIDSATGKHIESCEREGCKAVRARAHDDDNGDCKCDINNCGKLIHSHKLVFHNPVPASCGKTGVDAYYTYLECDKAMFAAEKTAGGYVAGAQISALPVTEALKCDQGGQWTPAENGNHEKYCTRCEAVVASAKHNFSEGIICSDCGAHESLKHRAAKPATCTESGNKEYWYSDISGKVFRDAYGRRETTLKAVTIAELGHKETGWVENGANHMQTCQRPGCTWFTTEAHSGSNSCICEKCGGYKEGHKWALKAMAPATCTEAGHEAYYECAGCEAMYNMDYEKIEAPVVIKAHELVKHEAKAAACTEAGHEAYYECAECRTLYDLKHNVIKAPAVIEGHKLIKHAGESATCTEAGYEAFYFCEECDKLYDMNHKEIEAPVVIKALGHKMNSTLIQDVKEGKHYNQCKNCSYKIYNEHTMVLSDPNKGNYHQWMCACGVLEIEKHYDKNGDKKCDACAHNQGGTSIKVEQHDNVTVQTGQQDTVQPNKSWLQNWLESLNANLNGGNKTTSTNSSAKSSESTSTANSGSSSATNSGSASTANSGSSSTANSGSASANNSGSSSTANSSASTNIGGSTNNGAAEENVGSVPSTGTPSTTTTVTAPVAAQASVIVQFVNWFLGLFGF